MEHVGTLLDECLKGMQQTFPVYGYDISMWQVYVFVVVAAILCWIIGGIISDD